MNMMNKYGLRLSPWMTPMSCSIRPEDTWPSVAQTVFLKRRAQMSLARRPPMPNRF